MGVNYYNHFCFKHTEVLETLNSALSPAKTWLFRLANNRAILLKIQGPMSNQCLGQRHSHIWTGRQSLLPMRASHYT